MQKALTPVSSSENDCSAETDTPLSSMSIGGRPLSNLRFADDINQLGSSEEELQQLTPKREKTAAEYGMGISSEKRLSVTPHIQKKYSNALIGVSVH